MPAEREQKIYDMVLKMVLWDEARDDVFQKLEVNGFIGDKAQEMYQRARAERVAAIRADCTRKAWAGLLWLGMGAGVFWLFWIYLGGITYQILVLSGVAMSIGTWKLVNGIAGIAMAHLKKGSLADEN